ncbi:MAG: hypothetical protein K0S48_2067 [Ramlibacter sp.]|jgi:ElaB/YqjD/DUF883 family membrane-anchored ribosome-binding protein|nr:hypothetical protein [Ramlibacter sp.]
MKKDQENTMTHPTRTSVGTRISDVAQEAREATTHALDSSRQFASEAVGKIGETARDLRDGAADLARSGAESVTDATVAAQRRLGHYATEGRRYVAREPLKSAMVAAAIGALAAALVMAWMRSQDEQRGRRR